MNPQDTEPTTHGTDRSPVAVTDGGQPECDYGDCPNPAVAIYEAAAPPDGSYEFYACEEHEPDAEPVAEVDA